MGANLLKIDYAEEQMFLKQTFFPDPHNDGADRDIWIGFSDQDQDGVFKWIDGERLTDSAFLNWADNQPNDRPGWDCGSIYAGNPDLKWETMGCFREQGFICKLPSGTELNDASHAHYPGCKPGWLAFKDPPSGKVHCYLFVHQLALSWDDAEKNCNDHGKNTHLASIHSGEEMSYLIESGHTDQWVGGKRTSSGPFQWSDGTDVDMDFQWGPGEPNTDTSKSRCTMMNQDSGIVYFP